VLNDKSKVPRRKRVANWDPKIVEYIRELRQQYPRLRKEKIKPFYPPNQGWTFTRN
jgi:hypothetical protein